MKKIILLITLAVAALAQPGPTPNPSEFSAQWWLENDNGTPLLKLKIANPRVTTAGKSDYLVSVQDSSEFAGSWIIAVDHVKANGTLQPYVYEIIPLFGLPASTPPDLIAVSVRSLTAPVRAVAKATPK